MNRKGLTKKTFVFRCFMISVDKPGQIDLILSFNIAQINPIAFFPLEFRVFGAKISLRNVTELIVREKWGAITLKLKFGPSSCIDHSPFKEAQARVKVD